MKSVGNGGVGQKGGVFEVIECSDQDIALRKVKEFMDKASSCVMVKGSHCANLDKLVAELVQRNSTHSASMEKLLNIAQQSSLQLRSARTI